MCNKKNEAPMTGQVEVFNFSQEKAPIRVQLINSEPWFVAKDVCEVLGIANHKDAASRLDEDERRGVGMTDPIGRPQTVTAVSESGLYSLIFQSRKAEAKKFRKWVTSEVLPSIRKKGYYGIKKQATDYIDVRDVPYRVMNYRGGEVRVVEWVTSEVLPSIRKKGYYGIKKQATDYIDVRDVPYRVMNYRGGEVRVVEVNGEAWYSLNDIHSCIGARTDSSQSVRRLNDKQTLARKLWLYGVPNPGWFVKELGVRLLLCASQKNKEHAQLMLDFDGKEG